MAALETHKAQGDSSSPLTGSGSRRPQRTRSADAALGGKFRARTDVGRTVPTDQAFVDVILEQLDSTEICNASNFQIQSDRKTREFGESVIITHEHHLTYKGEAIFVVATRSVCDGTKLWGTTSTCVIKDGSLKVKFTEKSRNYTIDEESGSPRQLSTKTSCVMSLAELVRESASKREIEILSPRRTRLQVPSIHLPFDSPLATF